MNKCLSLLLLLCLVVLYGHATNYYVSARGNDASPGTSPGGAWATIAKVNRQGFRPGDSILFRSGDVFTGELMVAASGQPGHPIVYGAYGTGARPVISGMEKLSSWTSAGRGIYTSPCARCKASDNMLVMDGIEYGIGRYPNSGYLKIDAIDGNKAFTASSVGQGTDWTGAEVVIKKYHWVIDRNKVTGQSGNTMQYLSGSGYAPYLYPKIHDYGYFIQNDPRTLDTRGEWYFDPSKGNMMVFFGGEGPGASVVQTAVVDTLVYINTRHYITFEGLSFQGGNHDAFWIHNARYITIDNCDIDFSGGNGVTASGSPYLHIAHSRISHSNNNGLDLKYGNNHTLIEWDTVKSVGMIPGMNESGDAACEGIFVSSPGSTIQNNVVDSTGYNGIYFSNDSILVKENIITNFLLTKGDGGGIYTFSSATAPIYHHRQLIGNIIMNGMGGTIVDRALSGIYHGIYMDGFTPYVDVLNNTVIRCEGGGIYLNLYSQHLTVTGNTVYDCGSQILVNKDSVMPNFIIRDNVLVSQADFQYGLNVVCIHPNLVSPVQLGSIDDNYYLRPGGGQNIIFSTSVSGTRYALGDWKRISGKDNDSKELPIAESNGNYRVLVNTGKESKTITLDGSYHDVKNARYPGSITLAPYSSIVLIRDR